MMTMRTSKRMTAITTIHDQTFVSGRTGSHQRAAKYVLTADLKLFDRTMT